MVLWFSVAALLAALSAQTPQPKPESGEDPGPPVLKRGGNAPRKPPSTGPDLTTVKPQLPPDPDAPPPAYERPATSAGQVRAEDLIERAREASHQYNEGLPNFLCDQLTRRYTSKTLKPEWKLQDRVEVELMYVDGREDYRNVRINGKVLKKGSPEDSGTWSTGDFGTILIDVLSTSTNANFKKRGSDTIAGASTITYDFTVEKANSHWQIRMGSSIKPAYKGALWIDPETARVMRVEMNTRQLPATYPVDTVEVTTEYGWVTIANQKYLLPLTSQTLSCQRDTFNCTKNDLEYKNYRKFTTESSVSTTDSNITFDEDEKPKPSPDPKAAPKSKSKAKKP